MVIKIINVSVDDTEFSVPKGYEPFHILRQFAEWVVFCKPISTTR